MHPPDVEEPKYDDALRAQNGNRFIVGFLVGALTAVGLMVAYQVFFIGVLFR